MVSIDIPSISGKMLERSVEALIILIVGYIIIRIVLRLEKKVLEKSKLDPSVYTLIYRVTRIALWVILLLTVLAELQINMAPIITAIGAGGVAVALALRDSLSNVAGGIILMFNQPFVAGDEIEINGNTGLVDRIDIMTTHMHTYDGKEIIIPNGVVTNSIVVNATRRDLRRVSFTFVISYQDDYAKVQDAILDVVANNKNMLSDPAPYIAVQEHTDRGVRVFAGVWAKTERRFDAEHDFPIEAQKKFEEVGISIPKPHFDIHVEEHK